MRVAAQDGQRPKDKPAIRAALDQLRLLVNPRDADAFGRVARSAKGMGEATLKSVLREAGIDSGRGGDGDGGGGGDGRLALTCCASIRCTTAAEEAQNLGGVAAQRTFERCTSQADGDA